MIDKVKLFKKLELDISKFDEKFRYESGSINPKIDIETGEVIKEGYTYEHFIYNCNSLTIKYIVASKKLCVEGRLVNILDCRNLVSNLSDYILDMQNKELITISSLEQFNNKTYNYIKTCSYIVDDVNEKIKELIGIGVDIREFNTSEVEVSFNIFDTLQTYKYIELFNLIYNSVDRNNHKNHVLVEESLSTDTSFYVKTKSSYENKINKSYTVNFYNKEDQLIYLRENKNKYSHILNQSILLSKNVLRLEVQLYYAELKKREKIFKYYLNIENCIEVITKKYNQFISRNENLKFYSYRQAKITIEQSCDLNSKDKKALLKYIKDKYSYNKSFSEKTIYKYNKILEILEIHPYFIPTKWKIDYLESPITIIRRMYKL